MKKQPRPLLAVLNEDSKKIRYIDDSVEFDNLINYLITLLNLKASSKEEIQDLNIQMVVIEDFIKSKFNDLTIPEVREAFKMYLAREFENVKVFRILDCVVVGEILNSYKEFRNDSLRVYDAKKQKLLIEQNQIKMSSEEINKIMVDAVNNKYREFLNTSDISEPFNHIFKELVEIGKLKMPTKETPKMQNYYDSKLKAATDQILSEFKKSTHEEKSKRQEIKEIVKAIESGEMNPNYDKAKVKIEVRAKKLVLIDYFTKQKESNLKNIL